MRGKATGERINGSTTRQIIQLAIQGESINQIALKANVDWSSAKAIIETNSKPIQERKAQLADSCYRVAFQATERLEDNLHLIPPTQLATVAGIMTDKVIALTQEPTNQINQHLHLHLNPSNMMEQFNDLVTKINAPVAPTLELLCDDSTTAVSTTDSNPEHKKQEQE